MLMMSIYCCDSFNEIGTSHDNIDTIIIEDEPRLKIRLLPKGKKRKTVSPDEPNEKKKKICLEDSAQDANTITSVFKGREENYICQIIDDEPKIKINLSSRKMQKKFISDSKAILSHNTEIIENSANIRTIEANKPKIKIHQNLVLKESCEQLDVLEKVSGPIEHSSKENKPLSGTLQRLVDRTGSSNNMINDNLKSHMIVIDEEPTIKIKLLPRKNKKKSTYDIPLPLHEAIKTFANEIHVLGQGEKNCSFNDKNRADRIKSENEAVLHDKSKSELLDDNDLSSKFIVIDEGPKINIHQHSVTKESYNELDVLENVSDSVECGTPKREPFSKENKPFLGRLQSLADETKSGSDMVNDNLESRMIVIDEEPTIKIKLLPRKKKRKSTCYIQADIPLHEAVEPIANETQVVEQEERNYLYNDKNRAVSTYDTSNVTHLEDYSNTQDQELFQSYDPNQHDVSVDTSTNLEKYKSLKVGNSNEKLESPLNASSVNLIQKSCDELDSIENDKSIEIILERKIEGTSATLKENKENWRNINENDDSLQMIDTDKDSRKKKKLADHFEIASSINETTNICSGKMFEQSSKSLLNSFLDIETQYSILDGILPKCSGGNYEPIINFVPEKLRDKSVETDQGSEATTDENEHMEKDSILKFESIINDRHELHQEINESCKNNSCDLNKQSSTRDPGLQKCCIQIGLNTDSRGMLGENGKVLACAIETLSTTVVESKIRDELDEEITIDSIETISKNSQNQTKNDFHSMIETPCDEMESVENNDPDIQLIVLERVESECEAVAIHDKSKRTYLNDSDLPSKVIVIDEEPKIKINFLSRGKKSQSTCSFKTSESTHVTVENSENGEVFENSFHDTPDQSPRCSEQYLGQNLPTNSKDDKKGNETKLGKNNFHSMIETLCDKLESAQNNDPEVQLLVPDHIESENKAVVNVIHDKSRTEYLNDSDLSSKVIVIDEEPKIKINFLSREKKAQSISFKTSKSTHETVENSNNEEVIDSFCVTQAQSSRCSEQYLGQNLPTNSTDNKKGDKTNSSNRKLGLSSDIIVIDEEQKIKISLLSKRKKKKYASSVDR